MTTIQQINEIRQERQRCRKKQGRAMRVFMTVTIVAVVIIFALSSLGNLSVDVQIAPHDLFHKFRKSIVPYDNTKNLDIDGLRIF